MIIKKENKVEIYCHMIKCLYTGFKHNRSLKVAVLWSTLYTLIHTRRFDW
jgi:hypothetical protein